MSDLTATSCGCGNTCDNGSKNGSFCWILILLLLCGCGNNGGSGSCSNGLFGGSQDGCGCESIILILILLCCCGGSGGFGCGC